MDRHGSDTRGRPSHLAECDHLTSMRHRHVHKAIVLTSVAVSFRPALLRSLKGSDEVLSRWSLQKACFMHEPCTMRITRRLPHC